MKWCNRARKQRGQILPIFCLLLALLLLPVAGLAVDGGLALSSHATLVGATQSAAEAAAQAVDVTALENYDIFRLCTAPDGGPDCGNGLGTVGEVVADVLRSTYPTLPATCTNEHIHPQGTEVVGSSGCAFDVIANCEDESSVGSSVGVIPDEVEVLAWQTLPLPLLVFPGWTDIHLNASATAWMEHGFGEPSISRAGGDVSC